MASIFMRSCLRSIEGRSERSEDRVKVSVMKEICWRRGKSANAEQRHQTRYGVMVGAKRVALCETLLGVDIGEVWEK
jgi:hypothetical protein